MKKLLLILAILLAASSLNAQTFKFLPFEYDAPNTQHCENFKYSLFKYDKARHFMLHTTLVLINPVKKYNIDLWTAVVFGIGYEIYDGCDWERSGGFSVTDLIFNVSGAILGVWLKDLCHSVGIYVLFNRNGISLHF